MFRRPGKNPLDELEGSESYYKEEAHLPYKYGQKKPEMAHPADVSGRLFDPKHANLSKPMTTPLEERRQDSFVNEKTSTLPHHFRGVVEEDPETTLGEGVSFRGELSFERLLRIDGTFEGELLSQGKVFVGPKGVVKANLSLREAVIEGKVEGNITVQERLELRGEAIIEGDITAKFLSVDEGVIIKGHVNITAERALAEGG